jgi:hypothetical protein
VPIPSTSASSIAIDCMFVWLVAIHCVESDVVDMFEGYKVRCAWFQVVFAILVAPFWQAKASWLHLTKSATRVSHF